MTTAAAGQDRLIQPDRRLGHVAATQRAVVGALRLIVATEIGAPVPEQLPVAPAIRRAGDAALEQLDALGLVAQTDLGLGRDLERRRVVQRLELPRGLERTDVVLLGEAPDALVEQTLDPFSPDVVDDRLPAGGAPPTCRTCRPATRILPKIHRFWRTHRPRCMMSRGPDPRDLFPGANMKTSAFLSLAAAILLSASAVAAEPTTLTGEFEWNQRGTRGDLEAIFTPTGEGSWDVDFHFEFRGQPHTYSGTATGSLAEGKLEGKVLNESKERTFIFSGKFEDGEFTGQHAEIAEDKEVNTGSMSLAGEAKP
jgi:hypothetical protein